MKPQFPSLTSEWHNNTYSDISPTRRELSAANKTIVVTGGGSGIGAETARSFAAAGAAHVAILGRTQEKLSQTKASISAEHQHSRVSTHVADVADESAMKAAAREIGKWDVLILNAGVQYPSNIEGADVSAWWKVLETNLKGTFVAAHFFLPTRNRDTGKSPSSAIVGVSAGLVNMVAAMEQSAYITSKMGQLKFMELLAVETPDCHILTVHPGVVKTDIMQGFSVPGVSVDDVKLPADFNVWAASKEAAFARGKMLWCNWDVPQLKSKAKEIEQSSMLTASTIGWPYQPLA